MGFPDGSASKASTCNIGRHRRLGFDPWVGKIPWRRKWQPTPVFLLGKSHGQRNLEGYSPKDCKELDTTEHSSTYIIYVSWWRKGPLRAKVPQAHKSHDGALGIRKENFLTSLGLRLGRQMGVSGLLSSWHRWGTGLLIKITNIFC